MSFNMDTTREYDLPTGGIRSSNPRNYFFPDEKREESLISLIRNDLRSAITSGFGLPSDDSYVYHAIASVTLAQVEDAVKASTSNGLCDWYQDVEGHQLGYPAPSDISAYVSIFSPTTISPGNLLKSLRANARNDSLRLTIAEHMLSKRFISSEFPAIPKPSKSATKRPLFNPYLDFWTWSCYALHWAGPGPNTARTKISHAVLPVFMHHFGCVVPSREALAVIKTVALNGNKKLDTVLDIGSGNGYWTYMLRAISVPVVAVDNEQSVFRCNWIDDTVIKDGGEFLRGREGGMTDVLMLIYPIVGANFFRSMLNAFEGDRLVVAGTQCGNGYTAFKDETVDEWMKRERREWTLEVRMPLPSFPGKDEALYVFRKKSK